MPRVGWYGSTTTRATPPWGATGGAPAAATGLTASWVRRMGPDVGGRGRDGGAGRAAGAGSPRLAAGTAAGPARGRLGVPGGRFVPRPPLQGVAALGRGHHAPALVPESAWAKAMRPPRRSTRPSARTLPVAGSRKRIESSMVPPMRSPRGNADRMALLMAPSTSVARAPPWTLPNRLPTSGRAGSTSTARPSAAATTRMPTCRRKGMASSGCSAAGAVGPAAAGTVGPAATGAVGPATSSRGDAGAARRAGAPADPGVPSAAMEGGAPFPPPAPGAASRRSRQALMGRTPPPRPPASGRCAGRWPPPARSPGPSARRRCGWSGSG